MKKMEKTQLKIERFKVSKLNNLSNVFGGNNGDDGNHTIVKGLTKRPTQK